MRASIICQRNLSGILNPPKSLTSTRSLLQNTQSPAISRQFYRSFWRDPSAPRAELSEIFQRIKWPTTKKQEAEVVEGVRTAIWGERNGDKRKRQEDVAEAKRRKIESGEKVDLPIYATQFSKEEIDGEERRPKKKVALLMGYSGTGYSGMQLNEQQRTIEGDLFSALVNVGAISKANAADPKKSSFVRCARTDKGVHAAGNVVSLKMIVEDHDIIEKINAQLSPQIRVWGYEVTSKSFSCYQMCDSRIYEYLMPSHCLLPPHPSTYLGRKIVELGEKAGELDAVKARQEEVATYWENVDEEYIKPILEKLPEDIRTIVEKSIYMDDTRDALQPSEEDKETSAPVEESAPQETKEETMTEEPATTDQEKKPFVMDPRQKAIINAIKSIKAAYLTAKRAYRAPASRIARLQESLARYEGTKNFHNYTIQKTYGDPSAKRHIKSFKANTTPIIINGTEWLSLKVHGQSFMMHQIRKMVAMATMVVRSGCHPDRITETYGPERIAIPKAPGLGLLLERPIFDSYNNKAASLDRLPINFGKFETEMLEFKQREIYDRIFREEEQSAGFGSFFNHIDHFPAGYFLYVTSGGIPAAKLASAPTATEPQAGAKARGAQREQRDALAAVEVGSEDEGEAPAGGEEEG
ncbi:hypothetical protein N7475_003123 [Penicillium sp. IBT 31633x]|nr:hypothetical protein N7475_003123 [Penicillium sp. IBT 31633x]